MTNIYYGALHLWITLFSLTTKIDGALHLCFCMLLIAAKIRENTSD